MLRNSADISTVMLVALAALWIPIRPLDFPVEPISHEIGLGIETYMEGKGLDRLYRAERQVVGTWFDGARKRDADHVVWVSPSLVSRWLGYLEAKEKWPDGELEARWAKLKSCLAGKLTFVVRLCAMPKVDLIEQEVVADGSERDALDIRFLWTAGNREWPTIRPQEGILSWSRPKDNLNRLRPDDSIRNEPLHCLLSEQRSRNSANVLRDDWWRRVPFGEALTPEFDRAPLGDDLPLGPYFAATYLVQLRLPPKPLPNGQFELRTFSPRRERVARYSILPGNVHEKP